MKYRTLSLLALAAVIHLAGCATSKQWAVSGGDRENGVVRVSYEYPEAQEPAVSEQAAAKLALNRCDAWGYDDVEPIAGQIRQCSDKEGSSCDLWRVTREFQCTRDVAYLSKLAK